MLEGGQLARGVCPRCLRLDQTGGALGGPQIMDCSWGRIAKRREEELGEEVEEGEDGEGRGRGVRLTYLKELGEN